MKEDEEEGGQTDEGDAEIVNFVHRCVHHFCPTVIHRDLKHPHERLRMDLFRRPTDNIDNSTHSRKCFELLQILDKAEQLHTDR